MKIALIDDEPAELARLSEIIKKQWQVTCGISCTIDTFCNSKDFLFSWKAGEYGVIVLDIYLDNITGIEIARKIRETDINTQLVFCTTSNEFASESYEVNAQYYILKPFSEKNITDMISRLNFDKNNNPHSLILSDGQEILLRNIIFTEYFNHIVTIHNKKGKDTKTRITHGRLEELLCCHPYFCCCSKGVIANFYEVKNHDKDIFLMSDGSHIPISRRKSKDVQNSYIKFCFEQMRKEVYLCFFLPIILLKLLYILY